MKCWWCWKEIPPEIRHENDAEALGEHALYAHPPKHIQVFWNLTAGRSDFKKLAWGRGWSDNVRS